MLPHRGRQQEEQDLDRLSVHRAEIDGLAEKTEKDQRLIHVGDDRITRMRDGDPPADAGRGESLPREKKLVQQLPVDARGDPGEFRDGRQDLLAALAGQVVHDAAVLECGEEAGRLLNRAIGGEQLQRHPVLVQRRPFLQLDAVEEVLVVDAMRGQRALASPPVDGLLGDVQQASDIPHFEVHGVCLS